MEVSNRIAMLLLSGGPQKRTNGAPVTANRGGRQWRPGAAGARWAGVRARAHSGRAGTVSPLRFGCVQLSSISELKRVRAP